MVRIDVLPDDVLLDIFDFHMVVAPWNPRYTGRKAEVEAWQLLVHVCQRWRSLVFASPRRLNMQLYCTPETPTRDTLDVWPALPLIVEGDTSMSVSGTVNVIAAFEHTNRVCEVGLGGLSDRQLEEVCHSRYLLG